MSKVDNARDATRYAHETLQVALRLQEELLLLCEEIGSAIVITQEKNRLRTIKKAAHLVATLVDSDSAT